MAGSLVLPPPDSPDSGAGRKPQSLGAACWARRLLGRCGLGRYVRLLRVFLFVLLLEVFLLVLPLPPGSHRGGSYKSPRHLDVVADWGVSVTRPVQAGRMQWYPWGTAGSMPSRSAHDRPL
ncbi:hypothetical protein NDU88_003597 [Pleurodeles waltl]|uniref:Uncharacterized protein n=1 Tax=Pleurodeles waltl TaxID=8319 RepID=A0AAV7MSX2_PLEWA|nr:hypothetical protein NDU88_003597 [Pleurodeles waltl]